MSRSRNYCFTFNNYTDEDITRLGLVVCRYMCYGKEVAPNTGTLHLQGFISFQEAKTLTSVKKLLPGNPHLEEARGSVEQNVLYCSKDGDFTERGEKPISQKRKGEMESERWDLALKKAKAGEVDDIPADIRFRYYKTIKEIGKDYMAKPGDLSELDNYWICGPPGCGKSRGARERFPGAYFKLSNKWWDGYQGEENVIIDDLELDHKCLGHHLKIWGDRYSFIAETKGGAVHIRPKRIIITSNYTISAIFEDVMMCEALCRRFKVESTLCPVTNNFNI